MRAPKIVASTTSLKATKLLIKSGASDLFVGMDYPDYLKRLTFTARGKYSCQGIKSVVPVSELRDIVAMAHDSGVSVNYLANMPAFPEGIVEDFKRYIEQGVSAGIDSIIVANLGALLVIHENWPAMKIHASSFMGLFNTGIIDMLKQYGVKRIILPHHLTIDEIASFVASTDLETEIFGIFGCSNVGGQCHLKHNAGERIDLGLPCRAKYAVSVGSKQVDGTQFFHCGADCSLCQIGELVKTDVGYIKIFGRDKDPALLAMIVQFYKMIIDRCCTGELSKSEIRTLANERFPWWNDFFCSRNVCKYVPNRIERFYIGNNRITQQTHELERILR